MQSHHDTGRQGEQLAIHWLRLRGFRILERNWRVGRLEVDIIAERDAVLHIVEVKTKRSVRFGLPEERAGPGKIRHLIIATEAYRNLHPEFNKVCFDVLAIQIGRKGDANFFWMEDLYV